MSHKKAIFRTRFILLGCKEFENSLNLQETLAEQTSSKHTNFKDAWSEAGKGQVQEANSNGWQNNLGFLDSPSYFKSSLYT